MKFKGAGHKQSLNAGSFLLKLRPHRLATSCKAYSRSRNFSSNFQNLSPPSSFSSFPFKMSSRDLVHSCLPEIIRPLLGFPLQGISPYRVPAQGN